MKEKIRKFCAKYFPEYIKKYLRPIYYAIYPDDIFIKMFPHKKYKSVYEDILPVETIKSIIRNDNIKTISFDIFDTLLVRPVIRPRDIFYLISSKVDKKYKIDFIKLRYDAEDKLQKKNATLQDIYDFISKENKLEKKITDSLMIEELATEKLLLSPRPDIKELYEEAVRCDKKIIATSDMYLPSEFLKEVLIKNGYTKISKVYVSNEYKKRKDTGDLYELIISDLNVKPAEIFHIGDNYDSDYLMAIKKNITAIYYPSIKDIVFSKHSIYRDIYSNNISDDPFIRILIGFIFNTVFSDRNKTGENIKVFKDLEMFSRLQIAPILIYIVLNITQNKKIQNNYNKIFFASRDGYLPQKAYDLASKYVPNLLPSEYLYVGRRAYYMALEDNFFDYLGNHWVDEKMNYTLNNIIDCYILDEKLNKQIKDSMSAEDLGILFLKEREKCINLLLHHKINILDYINSLGINATKYYSKKIHNGRNIVFDLGYSGSVSQALTKMTKSKIDKIYLWSTKKNKKLDKKNKTKTLTLFKDRHPTEHIVLEELFSPLQGSCIGFTNELKPIFENINFTKEMITDIKVVDDTSIDLVDNFFALFKDYLIDFKIKDIKTLQKVGQFTFTQSPFNEESIFENIIFPDNIFTSEPETLSRKILKHRPYRNVFDGTGFENPLNKIDNIYRDISNIKMNIGIHIHLYNTYMYSEFFNYLKDFPVLFDLIITINDKDKLYVINNIFNKLTLKNVNNIIVKVVPNRGRDVAPWLIFTKDEQKNYDIFCHVHSKESNHFDFSNEWRSHLLNNLIKSDSVLDIIYLFNLDEKLGCVFPDCFFPLKSLMINRDIPLIGNNKEDLIIKDILEKLKIKNLDRNDLIYSAGTMFWYRPEALKPLFDLNLEVEDFPEEPIGIGGTIAHAIERIPSFVAKKQGFKTRIFTKY